MEVPLMKRPEMHIISAVLRIVYRACISVHVSSGVAALMYRGVPCRVQNGESRQYWQ